MGKELLLLRHAKSSWDDVGVRDIERGLNDRGRRNAPQMGRALAQHLDARRIQRIHVSPARRAQLTLGGLLDGWPALQRQEHVTEPALYTFDCDDLVAWLETCPDSAESLLLIGHNPAFTDLVNWLTASAVLDNLPTAGFAQLSLDIAAWDNLASGCGQLRFTLFPRSLDGRPV